MLLRNYLLLGMYRVQDFLLAKGDATTEEGGGENPFGFLETAEGVEEIDALTGLAESVFKSGYGLARTICMGLLIISLVISIALIGKQNQIKREQGKEGTLWAFIAIALLASLLSFAGTVYTIGAEMFGK